METIVEILIDNSGSMGPFEVKKNNGKYLLPDGNTRMSLAKKILVSSVLPALSYAQKISIRLFHSVTEKDREELKNPAVYDSIYDLEKIIQVIEQIPDPINTGGTPITAAIKYSIEILSQQPFADRKIVLVTDGEENGGGDYLVAAKEALAMHGIPCNIFVIGIALESNAIKKANQLTVATKGNFVNLRESNYNPERIKSALGGLMSDFLTTSITNAISATEIKQKDVVQIKSSTNQTTIPLAQKVKENIPVPHIEDVPISPTEEEKGSESKSLDHSFSKEREILAAIDESAKKFEEISKEIHQDRQMNVLILKQLQNLTSDIKEIRNNENDDETVVIFENQEDNEKVRLASERLLFEKLRLNFGERVKWMNEEKENGYSYDFEVKDCIDSSIEYYIECKASKHSEKVFLMTKHEWLFFLANSKNYQLYFVSDALSSTPEVTKIDNFMDWLLRGKVVPFTHTNRKLKAERIAFTIVG